MTHLGTVKPLLFDRSLIISLTQEWLDHFGKIPEFDVCIDKKGRLCIISKDFIKKGRCKK